MGQGREVWFLACLPVRIDFTNKGHGDREIDEFTVGHADFERLGDNKRRGRYLPNRKNKHLGL